MRASEELQRLFVALELPEAWRQALAELQQKIREALASTAGEAAPRLRWTRPEGTHLTLKFLGETPRSRSAVIDRALRQTASGVSGFDLTLDQAATFGDRRGPRVIFAGVAGETAALRALAERVDAALAEEGFARERRPFQAHLTLARLPEQVPTALRPRLSDLVAAVRTPRAGPHHFGSFSLMQSHIERGGARYERVRGYHLR